MNKANNPANSSMPIPRLCVLTKLSGVDEYGFNLHAEMGRGQFVGAVDVGGSAQMADLRPGDHIVAVNGESIEGLSHKEVVQRIKSNPIRCSLLVLDEEGILWYKENNLPITAEHILGRLNAVAQQSTKWEQKRPAEQEDEDEEVGVDVPIPLPRKQRTEQPTNLQMSPASRTSYGGTDLLESGSCSIALPASIPGSPLSNALTPDEDDEEQRTPIPVQLLTLEEEQQQKKQQPIAEKFPPVSPKSSIIGRHATAVSVPPPATLLANGPKPRLCTLQKSNALQEFGFNLHAERGKGHFIGAVDKNGIAELAGLETGQRIVGVNGQLVFPNTPHKEIVQLIKRDPLCTELLVASEEVDRFYAEYGLAFTYDFVQIFYRIQQQQNGWKNGIRSSNDASSAIKNGRPIYGQQISRQNRTNSSRSSSTSMDGEKGSRNGNEAALRIRGNSLGRRPPTPTSTYSTAHQNGGGHVLAVAVQIEQLADNMTSIEIAEMEEMANGLHQFIGIGTPPSSRCDEKFEKEEDGSNLPLKNVNENGELRRPKATMAKEVLQEQEQKHVIADSTPPPSKMPHQPSSTTTNRSPMNNFSHRPLQPLTIFPPNNPQVKKVPLSIPSPKAGSVDSSKSRGSSFEKRHFGKNIFALNAKDARKAICGRKKDPRLEGQMSLEEKHRLILDM